MESIKIECSSSLSYTDLSRVFDCFQCCIDSYALSFHPISHRHDSRDNQRTELGVRLCFSASFIDGFGG
jgi:hypothetical protein